MCDSVTLVGHHADRQHDAECAGQAQFVTDAIELDHVSEPQITPNAESTPAEAVTRAPQS